MADALAWYYLFSLEKELYRRNSSKHRGKKNFSPQDQLEAYQDKQMILKQELESGQRVGTLTTGHFYH